MMRLWIECFSAAFAMTTTSPAIAIEFPLGSQARLDAKAAAPSLTAHALDTLSAYQVESDRATWIGFTPKATITTPYVRMLFAISLAGAKYEKPDSALLDYISVTPRLEVSTDLFSVELGANADPVGIIDQNGKQLKAKKRTVGDESVVDTPQVGYSRSVSMTFDLSKINLSRPFTVIFANIPVFASTESMNPYGEIQFVVDPQAMR